jgi:glyoxylase-like metal-dependent hydrolase (beta-lactamase superfamily II)
MLLTHYHLDHLMGLPSFPPLYRKKWTIEIVAPIREGVPASQAVRRILDKPFWRSNWINCTRGFISRTCLNRLPWRLFAIPALRSAGAPCITPGRLHGLSH